MITKIKIDGRDKPKMKILIQNGIFAERLDMSGRVTRQIRKSILEFDEKGGHIRCPKLDSLVYKTGYSGFDWTNDCEGTLGNFRS
jgi:hypothetical protein